MSNLAADVKRILHGEDALERLVDYVNEHLREQNMPPIELPPRGASPPSDEQRDAVLDTLRECGIENAKKLAKCMALANDARRYRDANKCGAAPPPAKRSKKA